MNSRTWVVYRSKEGEEREKDGGKEGGSERGRKGRKERKYRRDGWKEEGKKKLPYV